MAATNKSKIGAILVEQGILTQAQIEKALVSQGQFLLPIGSTILKLNLAADVEIITALAMQAGVPGVDLKKSVIATELLDVIPRQVAESHRVLPMAFSGGSLQLALAKPTEQALIDEIAFASGRAILPYVAPQLVLDDTIRAAYSARADGTELWRGEGASGDEPTLEVIKVLGEDRAPVRPESQLSNEMLDDFAPAPQPIPRPNRDKPRILVVDDEIDILDLLETALTRKGMEVIRASRGREALEKLQASSPDLVLLDAMLPEIHGFEICSKIKQSDRFRHIPVIIISAIYTGWNFIADVKRIYGADDYITKPFRIMEVLRRVEDKLAEQEVRESPPEFKEANKVARAALREAMELFRAGEFESAVAIARRAVQVDPFDSRTHFVYAMALHRAGNIFEAISVYERVVELSPSQFGALKNLAVLYERQGFRSKAVEMWMRALDNSPTDAVRQTIKAHLFNLL